MSSLSDLVVPNDELVVWIDYNGITRIVSEIIINKSGELTLYTDILFSIVRLMYHGILIHLDIDAAKTVFELIGAALQREKDRDSDDSTIDDSTWVISKEIFSEDNMRHVVSNIKASAYLIYMTLLQNKNFTINSVTTEFLGSLSDRGTLIEWLRQMTENSATDGYISMTNQRFKTSLIRLNEQRGAYAPINIEGAIKRTDGFATYNQYCQKS